MPIYTVIILADQHGKEENLGEVNLTTEPRVHASVPRTELDIESPLFDFVVVSAPRTDADRAVYLRRITNMMENKRLSFERMRANGYTGRIPVTFI